MTDLGGSDDLQCEYTPTIVDVQSYYVMARRRELLPQPQDLTPLSREFDRALEAEVVRRVAEAKANPAIALLIELAKDYVECVDGEWGCCHSYTEVTERLGCAGKGIATEVEFLIRALAVEQEWKPDVFG